MARRFTVSHRFVDIIPSNLEDGVIYISIVYGTVVHKCCCGCGEEVVTPLSPTDWKLIYDGQTICLTPSIGNWSLKCRSHYLILRNRVHWARGWSDKQIELGRQSKALYYAGVSTDSTFFRDLDLIEFRLDEPVEGKGKGGGD